MPIKFQILSDTHLELCSQYPKFIIPVEAPNLILAGDIGTLLQYDLYLSFLRAQCSQFERVFLVLGNHEFYDLTHDEGVAIAERFTREEGCIGKLFLLNRGRFDFPLSSSLPSSTSPATTASPRFSDEEIPQSNQDENGNENEGEEGAGMTILGCTLHSHIRPSNALMTSMKVSDFTRIQDWTTDTHNAEHVLDVQWLTSQIKSVRLEHPHRKILVITHHAPFRGEGSGKPGFANHPWTDGFATNLLEVPTLPDSVYGFHRSSSSSSTRLSHQDQDQGRDQNRDDDEKTKDQNPLRSVNVWIFGHTHFTTDTIVPGTQVRCVANQRGYVFPAQFKAERAKMQRELGIVDDNDDSTVDERTTNDNNNNNNHKSGREEEDENQKEKVGKKEKKSSSMLRRIFTSSSSAKKKSTPSSSSSFKIIYPTSEQELSKYEGDGDVLKYNVRRCIEL